MAKRTTLGWAILLLLTAGTWAENAPTAKDADSSGGGREEAVPPRGGQGSIKIVTTPEKAIAYLDGVKLGLTPVDTAFESGRKTLTILLNGEELVRERINIWPNQATTIEKKLLMPYGSITIKPNPLKANYRITVDGEEVGMTRGTVLTINRLEAGTRVIKVAGAGKSREYNVNILAEQTVDLDVDFAKKK